MHDSQQTKMVVAMSMFAVVAASLNLLSNDDIPIFGGGGAHVESPLPPLPPPFMSPPFPSLPAIPDTTIPGVIDDAESELAEIAEHQEERREAFELLRDSKLTSLCVIGSVAGAFLAVSLFPIPSTRKMAAKFGSSMIAGSVFTPAIVRWCGLPMDADYVLAISTAIALVSVAALHVIVPTIEKLIKGRVDKAAEALGQENDPHKDSQ